MSDYEEGKKQGVNGTPTFFVNGKKVESSIDAISTAIDADLKGMTQRL
jgi:protein-disulfide isomerase